MEQFGVGYLLTAQVMRWFWTSYTGCLGDDDDLNAFSLLHRDLSCISAATVITAEFDPLRDEGEALTHQLRLAGVPTTGRRFLGMIHGFATLPALTPAADRVLNDMAADIRVSFQNCVKDRRPGPREHTIQNWA